MRSTKKHLRELTERHILEMRDLKAMLASANELVRKSEGMRKGEAVVCTHFLS